MGRHTDAAARYCSHLHWLANVAVIVFEIIAVTRIHISNGDV